MIRAGLIWNQHSHRNRGAGREPLPEHVLDIVPAEPSELFAGLRRFASEGVDLVVVDGGDGTMREVLTRLPEAYAGRIPRLAVLPSGKTNALALDLGVPSGTTLEQLLSAADSNRPAKQRCCLEIWRAGQALPERRGFLFGTGAFVHATELAQSVHGRGFFDQAAIAATLGGAVFRTLFGGPHDPWRRGEETGFSLTGAPAAPLFIILASTLKRLPLGLKPFGPPREGLKVLSVAAPPRRLVRALPIVLSGRERPWLAHYGYRRDDVEGFDVDLSDDFVLDGEIYDGGGLSVRRGPALEFVVP